MSEILDGLATCIERECAMLGQYFRKVLPKSLTCEVNNDAGSCNALYDCRWNAATGECEPDIWSTIDDHCPFKEVMMAETTCAQQRSGGNCHKQNDISCEWRQEFHCKTMTGSEQPKLDDRCQLSPTAATLAIFGEGDPDK